MRKDRNITFIVIMFQQIVMYYTQRAGQGRGVYGMGWDGMGQDVRWMDLPVCKAYLGFGFNVSAPLQEEGD